MSFTDFIIKQIKERENERLEKIAEYDDQVKMEIELIKRYQQFKDPFALNKLTNLFKGTIAKSIRDTGITSVISEDIAQQEALNKFKGILLRYDVDQDKKPKKDRSKPNTFVTSSLKGELQKVRDKYSGSAVKMSEPLRGYNRSLYIAENMLKAQNDGKEPTTEELFNFMRNEMQLSGKKLNIDEINKIKKYRTKELSSSQIIGNTNADGAEELSFADINNTVSIEDTYNRMMEEQAIINKIRNFSDDKQIRTLLMCYFGLGEFKFKKADNKSQAALAASMTYYDASKNIDSFINFLKKENGVNK